MTWQRSLKLFQVAGALNFFFSSEIACFCFLIPLRIRTPTSQRKRYQTAMSTMSGDMGIIADTLTQKGYERFLSNESHSFLLMYFLSLHRIDILSPRSLVGRSNPASPLPRRKTSINTVIRRRSRSSSRGSESAKSPFPLHVIDDVDKHDDISLNDNTTSNDWLLIPKRFHSPPNREDDLFHFERSGEAIDPEDDKTTENSTSFSNSEASSSADEFDSYSTDLRAFKLSSSAPVGRLTSPIGSPLSSSPLMIPSLYSDSVTKQKRY